jgi:hypothetical protein
VCLDHGRGRLDQAAARTWGPSHFNTATTLDNTLFTMGGVASAVTILVTAAMTLAAFTRATAGSPLAWAIRSGLVALLAAQAIGVWMIVHGLALLDAGAGPRTQSMSTYGAAGAMKLAHAVPPARDPGARSPGLAAVVLRLDPTPTVVAGGGAVQPVWSCGAR